MKMITRIATGVAAVLLLTVSQVSAEDRFFTSDGVRLRYAERGQGDLVVILHGNGSWIETMWGDTGVIDALASRYRVVALDFRGPTIRPHTAQAWAKTQCASLTISVSNGHMLSATRWGRESRRGSL